MLIENFEIPFFSKSPSLMYWLDDRPSSSLSISQSSRWRLEIHVLKLSLKVWRLSDYLSERRSYLNNLGESRPPNLSGKTNFKIALWYEFKCTRKASFEKENFIKVWKYFSLGVSKEKNAIWEDHIKEAFMEKGRQNSFLLERKNWYVNKFNFG